jgi:aryl-alcohol dehydrogenase-like predicted oxidoreductase
MGEAIKELGWKRSDVVLSTKIFWVSTTECFRCCSVFLQLKQQHHYPVLRCYRVQAVDPMTRVSAANTSSRGPRCMTGRESCSVPSLHCCVCMTGRESCKCQAYVAVQNRHPYVSRVGWCAHLCSSESRCVRTLQASLKRMDVDYVDLVFAHRPDINTPIEETVRAFNWLIDNGHAFYWGTSEWTAQQITEVCP